MKKLSVLMTLCLIVCMLTGCTASTADGNASAPTEPPDPFFVDLDLSGMSGTVVYAQVYNLMCEYESWLGRIIRISGYYSVYEDTERGVVYHACVIPDATACCAQGIEFVWAGEHPWPDGYPEQDARIMVTGRLETYTEDGTLYLHLVDADLVWATSPEADARPDIG